MELKKSERQILSMTKTDLIRVLNIATDYDIPVNQGRVDIRIRDNELADNFIEVIWEKEVKS